MQTYITKYYKVYYLLMTHLIKMQPQGGNNYYIRMDYCADSASSVRCVRARQLQSSQVTLLTIYFHSLFLFGTNSMNKKDELARTKSIKVFIPFAQAKPTLQMHRGSKAESEIFKAHLVLVMLMAFCAQQ